MILNSDTITAIAAAISVIISVIAIALSLRAKKYAENRSCIETAISLTTDYQVLLIDMKILKAFIVEHDSIISIIEDKIKLKNLFAFNKDELDTFFNRQQFDLLDHFFTGADMKPDLMRKYYIIEKRAKNLSMDEDINGISNDDLRFYYSHKIGQILNKLEAITMAFVNNIASSKVVYQSLHQSFFQIVTLLYFPLSKNNIQKKDHYYSSIITLFKEWRNFDIFLYKTYNDYPIFPFDNKIWNRYPKKAKARKENSSLPATSESSF